MKLVYTLDDGSIEEYDFEPGRLMSSEADAIEDLKQAKWDTFEEFGQMFLKGSTRAHKAALWIMKRRNDPTIKFTDLDYPLTALKVSLTDAEKGRFRDSIESNPNMDAEQKEWLLNSLDLDTHAGELKDGTDLKDPSPNSGTGDSTSALPDSAPGSESLTAGP
jgi:hypothetical protein